MEDSLVQKHSLEEGPISTLRLAGGTANLKPKEKEGFKFFKSRKKKARKFLAVASERDNLAVLLECIYTARSLKKKHENFETCILVHPDNIALIQESNFFDHILPVNSEQSLRKQISKARPEVLYVPDPGLKSQLATLFTGAKVRIGGSRLRLASFFLSFYRTGTESDLERLRKKGLNLVADMTSISLDITSEGNELGLPQGNYVWLSLFEAHDITSYWPVGHASRLARLLSQAGVRIVVPVPEEPTSEQSKEIAYLKKTIPDLITLSGLSPAQRATGMRSAVVVIGAAGPETLLAAFMKRPVLALHDMRSYRHNTEAGNTPQFLKLLKSGTPAQSSKKNGVEDNAMQKHINFKLAESLQRHVRPPVDECNNDCPTCSYNSCVEHISPEWVYENVKKIIFPF